jgi:hypothetical protein
MVWRERLLFVVMEGYLVLVIVVFAVGNKSGGALLEVAARAAL